MDQKRYKRKLLLGLITAPLTLVPVGLGCTLYALLSVMDKGGPAAIAGAAGVLVGAGIFLQRLLCGCPKLEEKAAAEVQAEEQIVQNAQESQREAELDELDRQLTVADDDPRPETALRDLRALMQIFRTDPLLFAGIDEYSAASIKATAQELFSQCVLSLRRTLLLYDAARQASDKMGQSILAQRDELLKGVVERVQHFNDIIQQLRTIDRAGNVTGALSGLGHELDSQLDAARRAGERTHSLMPDAMAPDKSQE